MSSTAYVAYGMAKPDQGRLDDLFPARQVQAHAERRESEQAAEVSYQTAAIAQDTGIRPTP